MSTARAKPHICFVAPTTWPMMSGNKDIQVVGGAEVQQSLIAPALAARGFKVSMLSLDYGQPELAMVKGVAVHRMYKPDAGLPVARFIYPRFTGLWSAMKKVDADIYFQRSATAMTAFVAAFCRMNGKHSIYSGASDVDFVFPQPDIKYRRDKWLFHQGMKSVHSLFVQNETQMELARQNLGRDSILMPNCYEPPAGARCDKGGYVLWVATMRPQKRPEFVFEMARKLPQYRFVLVGGSDPDAAGQRYVQSVREAMQGLPNVEYRGFLPYAEADRVFDGARVVLSTSTYEGFPNIFLQGWARGIPAVAFVDTRSRDADGRPVYDIVQTNEEATARVERLMRDDAHWEEASRRSLAHFRRHHSLEAVAAMYESQLMALMPTR